MAVEIVRGDIELRHERNAKPGPPGARSAPIVNEDVGLQRAEALLAHLGADRLYAVQAGDCGLVQGRMIYPPSRAMRPINPDTVAKLAAEERVARHAERLGLGVEQRVLDGAEPLGDNASGSRTGEAIQLGIDPLAVEHRLSGNPPGEPLDDGADPGRAETLIKLAPADDALVGCQFEEVIIPPAGIAAKNFESLDLHWRFPPHWHSR